MSYVADFVLMDIIFITIYILMLNILRKYLHILKNDDYEISSKIIDIEEEIQSNQQNYIESINDENIKYKDKYDTEKSNIHNRSKEIIEYIYKEKKTIRDNYIKNKHTYIQNVNKFQYKI